MTNKGLYGILFGISGIALAGIVIYLLHKDKKQEPKMELAPENKPENKPEIKGLPEEIKNKQNTPVYRPFDDVKVVEHNSDVLEDGIVENITLQDNNTGETTQITKITKEDNKIITIPQKPLVPMIKPFNFNFKPINFGGAML